MASVRLELHVAAFNEYRNSPEVVAAMEEIAGTIQAKATEQVRTSRDSGEPFDVRTVHHQTRAVTYVSTSNLDGILAEATDRALTKAIG